MQIHAQLEQKILNGIYLEATIHTHQTLYEGMCQAYTEVHSTSKKLLYQLDHLVQLCKQPSSEERKHVRLIYFFCYGPFLSLVVSIVEFSARGSKVIWILT